MSFFYKLCIWLGLCAPLLSTTALAVDTRPGGLPSGIDPGELKILSIDGKPPSDALQLPLTHTDVQITVTGFVASATVTQDYTNPFDKPIEAVYTFPLPHKAAVDSMTMHVGDRIIRSLIKKRDEARQIYAQAKAAGQRTALLEQERPNIFTQSVGNIMPGDKISIEITYVDLLDYHDDGAFELVFPMVVGPRYIPGTPKGKSGGGFAPDTDRVPDASRITPPVLKPNERSGHDIALHVNLDAHLKIQGIHSISHSVDITEISDTKNLIKLHQSDTIPNKDFILRYEVAGTAPEMAVIAHHNVEQGGYFTFMALPQQKIDTASTVPRDLIFILDTSGSMDGIPMEQSKQAMYKLMDGMRTTDRFNVVRFAGDTGTLWPEPRLKTEENVNAARNFVASLEGSGGTEMLKGINEALTQPADDARMRIAFLLTDGYVGNEEEILADIEKERRGARVFTLGVGSSVNRYLLDQAAVIGLGEAFYVRQDEDATDVINKIFKRVDRPNLAHIEINWRDLDVTDVTPNRIPDLWQGRPILVHGRYRNGGSTKITVKGILGTKEQIWELPVILPVNEPNNAAMATVWARAKVEELMLDRARSGRFEDKNVGAITELGLKHKIMTQWTSFVAVEEKVVNKDGKATTVVQPVELPEGVSHEGVFGSNEELDVDIGNYTSKGIMSRSASPRAIGTVGTKGGGGGGAATGYSYKLPSIDAEVSFLSSREKKSESPTSQLSTLATAALQAATEMLVATSPAPEPTQPEYAVAAPGKETKAKAEVSSDKKDQATNCQYRAVSVSGAIKYSEVYKQLREGWSKLCKTLQPHNTTANTIAISFTIDANGKVTQVTIPSEDSITKDLANAIRKGFAKLTFTATVKGETTVKLTLELV
jgi:Ca-activated chloride channel family protein